MVIYARLTVSMCERSFTCGLAFTKLTSMFVGDRSGCQGDVFPHNVLPHLGGDLDASHQELDRKLSRLHALELTLRRSYPRDIEAILKVVDDPLVPAIYVITPTHTRVHQKAELTRLSHTFLHVNKLHWIIVEDSLTKTDLVSRFLSRCGLRYTHLNVATPTDVKMKSSDPHWLKPRGVLQRNKGLEWLRENLRPSTSNGVVYFADDDNTYDLQLFEQVSLCCYIIVSFLHIIFNITNLDIIRPLDGLFPGLSTSPHVTYVVR